MMQADYALITGASSGIGAAMARHVARQGFHVGLVARREERLKALADDLRAAHDIEADIFPADLSAANGAEALVDAVRAAGRTPTLLVNNAGVSIPEGLAYCDFARQDSFLELTIRTPVVLAHAFLPAMLEAGAGRIINISSITALSSGGKGHTLYPAGKAFLLKFSQSLAAEVAPRGVLVTAVLPGFVKTEFQEAIGMADKMDGSTDRFAQRPEDVAREAFERNARGAEIVVPGFAAKTMAAFMRYCPERLVRALTRPAAAKYYVGD